jgi:hypothetical protein
MRLSRLSLLLALGLLVGCDSRPDYFEYPGTLDLEALSVAELRTTAPVPGRYNVRGTAVEITTCFCQPGADCAPCEFPNGLIISETGEPLPADSGYFSGDPNFLLIEANDPEQFRVGQRYELSVEVEEGYEQRPVYLAQLLGYERAE